MSEQQSYLSSLKCENKNQKRKKNNSFQSKANCPLPHVNKFEHHKGNSEESKLEHDRGGGVPQVNKFAQVCSGLCDQTDRQDPKYYLLASSLSDGKYSDVIL